MIGSLFGSLPLGFAQPLVLLGLLSLPVLWWLLRLVPPRPRRINFPPTRLLFEISPKEETPQRTPWWLTLLRLTLAALIIIAAAGPLWNPPLASSSRAAPILLMLDDGWAAAASWDERLRAADELMARAEVDNRRSSNSSRSRTASSAPRRCRCSIASSRPRRTSKSSGSRTASISARAPTSSKA